MSKSQMVLDPWDDEQMARAGVELAQREERLEKLKREKSSAVKGYNGDIADLEESISKLAAEIRRQKASRGDHEAFEEGLAETDVVDAEEVEEETKQLPPAALPEGEEVAEEVES